MKRESCSSIGHLTRTHGNKGVVQVNLRPEVENPIQSEQYIFILINERDQTLVPFFVVSTQQKGKASLLLTLKFVDSEEDARAILNKEVFVQHTAADHSSSGELDIFALKGFEVIDEQLGAIGQLKSVDEYPSQVILNIVNQNSDEILIPLTDETIIGIDTEKKILTIATPDGLVELYTSEDG